MIVENFEVRVVKLTENFSDIAIPGSQSASPTDRLQFFDISNGISQSLIFPPLLKKKNKWLNFNMYYKYEPLYEHYT